MFGNKLTASILYKNFVFVNDVYDTINRYLYYIKVPQHLPRMYVVTF